MKIALNWGFITAFVGGRFIDCPRGRIIISIKQIVLSGIDKINLKNCLQDAMWFIFGDDATMGRFGIAEGANTDSPIPGAVAKPVVYELVGELDLMGKDVFLVLERQIPGILRMMYADQISALLDDVEIIHAA